LNKKKPAFLYTHGGGFIEYYGVMFQFLPRKIMREQRGEFDFYIIDYNFTIATEHDTKFPFASIQCFDAYKYIQKHMKELKISEIWLSGDSAGANLAIQLAYRALDYNEKMTLEEDDDQHHPLKLPTNALLFSPFLTTTSDTKSLFELGYNDAYNIPRSIIPGLWSTYARSENDLLNQYYNVFYRKNLTGFPSTMIFTGNHDPLQDDGYMFTELLRTFGIKVLHFIGAKMPHDYFLYDKLFPDITTITFNTFYPFAQLNNRH